MENRWLVIVLLLLGCNKAFDEPEAYPDPAVTPTMTIRQLKALHTFKGRFDRIQEDAVISGIVTADDRTGNFYKSIVIQDETGGLMIRLESTALFNDYPIGRRVYIRARGLLLNDYRGLMQLGADIDLSDPADLALSGIAAPLISRYVLKGSLHNAITPVIVTADQLTTGMQDVYQNMLVQLQHAELAAADSNATYAGAVSKQAGSYLLQNCDGPMIALRTSAYASFAAIRLPGNNGNVTGIYTVFNSEKQLMIRDTADVQLYGPRCTGGIMEEEEDEPYTAGISLEGTSQVLFNCDHLDSLWPSGMRICTGSTAVRAGEPAIYAGAKVSWGSSAGGFKNLASAVGLTAASTQAQQQAATDRCLGIRQVTATDKGVALLLEINNTLGRKHLTLDFLLQSLDGAAGRTAAWTVDYALGSHPASFIPVATTPALLTTGNGIFGVIPVQAILPDEVSDSGKKLTVRLVILSATTGSGNRPATGIDNIRLGWE